MKSKQLELKRRLELVRTTVRELTPTELGQVNGGATTIEGCQDASRVACCFSLETAVGGP